MPGLEVDVLEAETVWHDQVRQCWNQLRACVSDLFISVASYIEAKRRPLEDRADQEFRQKLERVVYAHGTNENPDGYAEKLSEAIEKFEGLLRPHLRHSAKPANWFRLGASR